MEPEICFGKWFEIDGPMGTEFILEELIGKDVAFVDQWYKNLVNNSATIPSELKLYCDNNIAYDIQIITGYGARFTMPGYLDCTPWTVFNTESEAKQYLKEQSEDIDV